MDNFVDRVTKAILPGAHLVDMLPVLDYLPDVIAKWRQNAKVEFQTFTETFMEMFLVIKNKAVSP